VAEHVAHDPSLPQVLSSVDWISNVVVVAGDDALLRGLDYLRSMPIGVFQGSRVRE